MTSAPLGEVPDIHATVADHDPALTFANGLRASIEVWSELSDGVLVTTTLVAGTQVGRREAALPASVSAAWSALELGPGPAGVRLADVGRDLAAALFDVETRTVITELVDRLIPGNSVDIVLKAEGDALTLPIELVRLAPVGAADDRPLCLRAGVTIRRQMTDAPLSSPVTYAGPLKVLAAISAPDETKTASPPLDVEAEMQAVLDATLPVAVESAGQVRILEVAHPDEIAAAIRADSYHVLHLSAHGSPSIVELADEDGRPVVVDATMLIDSLRRASRPVPLIVLAACSGAAGYGSEAMAAGLLAGGADRVIAMQASVSDLYATALTSALYEELVREPTQTVADALAAARYSTEAHLLKLGTTSPDGSGTVPTHLPEWGTATLLCAGDDLPLVDPSAPPEPLTKPQLPPASRSVHELPLGQLIGRRPELRTTTAVLRRTESATDEYGSTAGVMLVGIGGIGKSAIAGRTMARLRADGWRIAVHEGSWSPTDLIRAVADAFDPPSGETSGAGSNGVLTGEVAAAVRALRDPDVGDIRHVAVIGDLVRRTRLLIVFDDFEQNLTIGGEAFLDPTFRDVLAELADASMHSVIGGGLLITTRYPVPANSLGSGATFAELAVPPLSPNELRRLLMRLPALRELDAGGRRMVARVIGGHPRLIQFVDALMRGGRSNLTHVQEKLRQLAEQEGIDLGEGPLDAAVRDAVILGASDILFDDLMTLLTPVEKTVLLQVAVCRTGLHPDEIAIVLSSDVDAQADQELHQILARLADLTLVVVESGGISVLPWTADLVVRNAGADLVDQHARAADIHRLRLNRGQFQYGDLLDLYRHLIFDGRYNDGLSLVMWALPRLGGGVFARLALLAEVRPLTPETEVAWLALTQQESYQALALGDLEHARALISEMLEQVEPRIDWDPADAISQTWLVIILIDLAQLAEARGESQLARAHLQQALGGAIALSELDPDNGERQRQVGLCHNRLGDLAAAAGDLGRARADFETGLRLYSQAAAGSPDEFGLQRDVAVSFGKVAGIALLTGDVGAARDAYEAELEIVLKLSGAAGADMELQRDLAFTYQKLGDVCVAAEDWTAAGANYTRSLDIRVMLGSADPAHVVWQRDLQASYNTFGAFALSRADLDGARALYEAALDMAIRIAAASPTYLEAQRDLEVSYNKMGDIAMAEENLAAADAAYRAAMQIADQLSVADPRNTDRLVDLLVAHTNLGTLALATQDMTAARSRFGDALKIAEELVALDSSNVRWREAASLVRKSLASVPDSDGPTG